MALTKNATIAAGASANRAAAASGWSASPGTWAGWEPPIVYLLLLTIFEIVAVGFLSRHLLK